MLYKAKTKLPHRLTVWIAKYTNRRKLIHVGSFSHNFAVFARITKISKKKHLQNSPNVDILYNRIIL